jgi:hypothetical protein
MGTLVHEERRYPPAWTDRLTTFSRGTGGGAAGSGGRRINTAGEGDTRLFLALRSERTLVTVIFRGAIVALGVYGVLWPTAPALWNSTTKTLSMLNLMHANALPVAGGGTGLASLAAGYIPFGAGTSALGSDANPAWLNSLLTAPIGSIFRRTDGGANTTLYIKESGTGNTGWVAK